jgi:NAD(P)-dependent dehydrogenase (short-subunit alcohol dehydrogenase family)
MEKSKHEAEVYVVTGAGGGMGKACARRFGHRGHVVLADLNEGLLAPISQELRNAGVTVETAVCDVSDRQAVMALAKRAAVAGRVRAIAHTAGVSPNMTNWHQIMAVDLLGNEFVLEAFLPLAQSGTVAVCIASMSAYVMPADPKMDSALDEPLHPEFMARIAPFVAANSGMAYGAAKRGVIRACQRWASQWGKRGARIVSLSPGLIDTPMNQLEFSKEPRMKAMLDLTPLGRMGKPEEIAATVDFLCSAEASFISACDILVDGGCVAAMTRAAAAAKA